MLILAKVSDTNFPDDLIETVKVSDLDNRGKHETIKCIFDLDDLNAGEMYDQIEPMIADSNKEFMFLFESANQIKIRETGGQLRDIRDMIAAARNRSFGNKHSMKVYPLKHQDPETFMMIARGHLGIAEGENARDDQTLSITSEPLGDRLYIRATGKMHQLFEETAKLVDAKMDDTTGEIVLDKPRLKSYPIYVDHELAFNSLNTMLEGRDGIRLDQDPTTGAILVLGRDEDHAMVDVTLEALSGKTGEGFAIIPVVNRDPADIIVLLQNLFGKTAEDTSGPVLIALSLIHISEPTRPY